MDYVHTHVLEDHIHAAHTHNKIEKYNVYRTKKILYIILWLLWLLSHYNIVSALGLYRGCWCLGVKCWWLCQALGSPCVLGPWVAGAHAGHSGHWIAGLGERPRVKLGILAPGVSKTGSSECALLKKCILVITFGEAIVQCLATSLENQWCKLSIARFDRALTTVSMVF